MIDRIRDMKLVLLFLRYVLYRSCTIYPIVDNCAVCGLWVAFCSAVIRVDG